MKANEVFERLTDAEALIALQSEQLKDVEASLIKLTQASVPDYAPRFEEVKQLIREQARISPTLEREKQLETLQRTISELPKNLPVEHHHHFEGGSRSFVLGGILLLVLTALATGVSFSLYRENSRLQVHDVKYRLVRLYHPDVALWTDSLYAHEPDQALQLVEKMEARQLEIARASELAKLKQEEAREAARQVEKLRERNL